MRSRRLIEKPTARRREKQLSNNGKINNELTEIVAISSSSSGDEADASPVNHQTDSKKKTVPKVEPKNKTVAKVGTKQKTTAKAEKEDERAAQQKKRKDEGEQSVAQQKKKQRKGEGEGSLGQRKNEKGEGGRDSVAHKKKNEKGQEGSKGTPKKKRKKEKAEEEVVTLPRSNGKGKGEEANKGTPRKKNNEEEDGEGVAKQKKKGKGEEGESNKTNLKKRKKKGEGEGEGREGAATQKNNQKKAGEEAAPAHLQISDTKNEKKKKEIKGNGKEKIVNSKKNKKDETTKEESEAHCEYSFPMSRIERIVRSELDDVRISQEALFLINKASEKFLSQFADDAYACSVKDHKNYVSYKHLASAVRKCKRLDFLSDFVPETVSAEKAMAERSGKT